MIIHTVQKNHLLSALPKPVLERLQCQLQLVPLPLEKVLYECGVEIPYIYFRTDSMVSLSYILANGASAEVAVVGNDGIVGIPLFMGGNTTQSRAIVQSAGHAFRLSAKALKQEIVNSLALQTLLLRYAQSLMTQIAQTAACNRHHSVDQQLCRWLLLSLDRIESNELVMTQELIAHNLGVRREGVNEAAGKLQRAGLIHQTRGHITVLNRHGLEARSCECYAVVKKESSRLLPAA
jgi:CRP-like cAMP-binding protein